MRHRTLSSLLLVFTVSIPVLVLAQTEVPHTFQAGQPARAAEVNENFDALEAAVDANSAAVEANAVAAQQNAEAITALSQGDTIVLDFSDPENCVITESGNYVLDRDWHRPISEEGGNFLCTTIGEEGYVQIDAPLVVLDMRNFRIIRDVYMCDDCNIITILSGDVTIRNGRVYDLQAYEDSHVRLENISGRAYLRGRSTVRNSSFSNSYERPGLTVRSDSVVENSRFHGYSPYNEGPPALLVYGDNTDIRNNSFTGGRAIWLVEVESALVVNNILEFSNAIGIEVDGVNNTVFNNVLIGTDESQSTENVAGTAITISGSANIVDGNIVKQLEAGLVFHQPGNFYGDNRVSADVPYSGTAGQTDWGSNVSY